MSAPILQMTVYGLPAAQGSKRHVGGGRMVESSKAVKPWRQDVAAAAREAVDGIAGFEPFTGPVLVIATFHFLRPKSHFRTGRHANELKPGAPVYVTRTPDLDKTLRSTFDALTTAGVWKDDAQAARLVSSKRYDTWSGATLELQPLQETR